MPILHVRNVPPKLYRRVHALAEAERRSLSSQVILLLEEGLGRAGRGREPMKDVLERLRARREALRLPRDWPGSLGLLKEDRAR